MNPAKTTFIPSFLLVLLALLCAAAPQAAFAGQPWQIARIMGSAWIIKADRSTTKAELGATIEPGQTLTTSSTGRAMIVSGQSVMMLAPDSAIAVKPGDEGKVIVLQQAGELDLKVEHRDTRYFSVETPYLAAVVKGTAFRVTIGDQAAKITVAEGSVQVDAFLAGKTGLLTAGQSVTANALGGISVASNTDTMPKMVRMASRDPVVAASTAFKPKSLAALEQRPATPKRKRKPAVLSAKAKAASEVASAGGNESTTGKPGKDGKTAVAAAQGAGASTDGEGGNGTGSGKNSTATSKTGGAGSDIGKTQGEAGQSDAGGSNSSSGSTDNGASTGGSKSGSVLVQGGGNGSRRGNGGSD